MKNTTAITVVLFLCLAASVVMMLVKVFTPQVDERELLARWPTEVSQALDIYDVDKLSEAFFEDFKDQYQTNRATFKALLLLEKNHFAKWKAVVRSTQVEWNPLIPIQANIQVQFDLSHGPDAIKKYNVVLFLLKDGSMWRAQKAIWNREP